jgi:UV DNA damage repair endonuclease
VYESPVSGLYINTLPGISLESIDKIADAEQITYLGVWADVQTEAMVRFKTDFITEVTKCYKITRECSYETFVCDNLELLANAWRYLLGNQLMVFRIYSPRLNRFTTIDLEQAKALRIEYLDEYRQALSQAVKLIDFSSCCEMQCGGNPETVVWLP